MTRLTSSSLAIAWEALVDARNEVRFFLFDAGLPAILLTELSDLADLMGRTEYGLKTQFHQAPLWVLQETEQACRNWLS